MVWAAEEHGVTPPGSGEPAQAHRVKTLRPAEPVEMARESGDAWPGRDWGRRLRDQVNQHLVRVFGSALLLEVISAGVQLSQIPDLGRGLRRAQR